MQINAEDLQGPALDWAATKCRLLRLSNFDLDELSDATDSSWYRHICETDASREAQVNELASMVTKPYSSDLELALELLKLAPGDSSVSTPESIVAAIRRRVACELGLVIEVPDALMKPANAPKI